MLRTTDYKANGEIHHDTNKKALRSRYIKTTPKQGDLVIYAHFILS